jgi:prepilin-type N-terminal cleavage/methylation domain-containing protein
MVLRKICILNTVKASGFSLMEVLLVMSMVSVIAGGTLMMQISFYQNAQMLSDRDMLVGMLKTARSLSMQNHHGLAHGVLINPDGGAGYLLFEGNSFETSDLSTQIRSASQYGVVVENGRELQVVFEQLSGNSNYVGEIKLADSNNQFASTTIVINYEGAIY